jgi:hypothetical protein
VIHTGDCIPPRHPRLRPRLMTDEARPRITVEFPYDPEDDAKRSATSQTFFAAWVNQFGGVEWTCTDEIDGPSDFAPLVDLMEGDPA